MYKDLYDLCKKFIKEPEITCSETIHQSDRIILNACEFIENICETIGYYNESEK